MSDAASILFGALTEDAPRFMERDEIRSGAGTLHVDVLVGGQWRRITVTGAQDEHATRAAITEAGNIFAILLGEDPSVYQAEYDLWPPDETGAMRLRSFGEDLVLTIEAIAGPITVEEHEAETPPRPRTGAAAADLLVAERAPLPAVGLGDRSEVDQVTDADGGMAGRIVPLALELGDQRAGHYAGDQPSPVSK